MHFIKHWRTNSTISTTLRINLSWCQWQAGTSQSILVDTDPQRIHYLEARWLPSTRQALHHFGATLILDNDFVQRPERSDDQHLMDIALRMPGLDAITIRIINYCRLYLHITTISEMFDATGNTLLHHISKCERPPWFDPKINVTIQRRPSPHQICHRWQPFCSTISQYKTRGPWHLPLRLRRETYCHCPNQDDHTFYHWYAGAYWECHLPQQQNSDRVMLTLVRPTNWTPSTTESNDVPLQAYVRVRHTIYTHPSFGDRLQSSQHVTHFDAPTFSEHIKTLDQWKQSLLSNVCWISHSSRMISALQTLPTEVPLMVVSDGSSLENQHMSFGVTIGLPTGEILVEISEIASGPPSSHRAESTGCLAGAVFCSELKQFTNMQFATLSVVAASDNQGMIKSLNDRMSYSKVYPNSTLRPDWDLLEEIIAVYRNIGLYDLQFEWVKGHQDDVILQHELTPQARFNIRSDQLASTYTQSQGIHLMPQSPLLPSTRCHLEINGTTITGKYRYHLRLSASEPPLFDYLTQRHHWDSNVIDSIDWEAFCMAARTYSSTEVHLLKLVHDKLPLRRQVSRHQCWTSDQCHYCSELDTMDHLQTGICNTVSIEFRTSIRKSITQYLSRRQCPPAFITMFLSTLQSWFDPAYPSPTPPLLEQTTIGLRLMTRGFISLRWRQDLSTSLKRSNGGHTPLDHDMTSTLAGLIKVMWNAIGQLWLDHLATIHETTKSTQSPITLESLRSRVRLIHALQPHTLPIHAHYFPSNLDAFLQKATIQSLNSYITHYLPPIEHSLKIARSAAMSAAETSPACPTPAPQSPTTDSDECTSPSSNPSPSIHLYVHSPTSHPAMEEPTHRKRNRRRRFTRVLQALTTWARRRRMSTTAT